MAEGINNKAYKYLYGAILSNELPLGSPISELEVAGKLGISRSPVREALKRMEAEGLVNHFPSRGTFVSQISLKDIEDIFDMRSLFELYALQTAYRTISDELIGDIEKLFLALNEKSTPEEYYKANQILHSTIINHGGNRRVEAFYKMLNAQMAIVMRISSKDPKHFVESRKAHLEIVRAVKARDLPTAERLLGEHIKSIKVRTVEMHKIISI